MAKELRREAEVTARDWEKGPEDVTVRRFIVDFFLEMDLKDLKKLVSYKVLDPEDRAIWLQEPSLYEELMHLREERKIKLQASIRIED